MMTGFSQEPAESIDSYFVDTLRNHLFASPGFDLPALNIQRGRDHGIPGTGMCV